MPALYFAYGSNMDDGEIRAHCPSCRYLGVARLGAHRLAFTRRSIRSGSGVADVLPAPGQDVWGALYELDEGDLAALDGKEGRGFAYAREHKRVMLSADGSEHEAVVYTVISKEPAEVAPSRAYLGRLIAAGEHRGLPQAYLAALARTEAVPAPAPGGGRDVAAS
jgi:gamma-glutamylcyclotransferase